MVLNRRNSVNCCQVGSRATIILFDFFHKKVKVGNLEWSRLRVLEVTVKFDSLQVELDKNFLKHHTLPGFEAYGSQETDEEAEQPNLGEGIPDAETNQDLEANGMMMLPLGDLPDGDGMWGTIIPAVPEHEGTKSDLEEALAAFMVEELNPDPDEYYVPGSWELPGLDLAEDEESVEISVQIDSMGNLLSTDNEDLEVVEHESKAAATSGLCSCFC